MTKKIKNDQSKTPIFSALIEMKRNNPVSFHVPGHKNGQLLPKEISVLIGKKAFQCDQTEIPGLDNLHNPVGVINESQRLLANAYGVKHSYFLVGGSTSGIKAMIMSTTKPGDKVIIGRDCHKSVISSLIISGIIPVFVDIVENSFGDFTNPASFRDFKDTIDKNKDAVAIFITSPNYFGLIPDIKKISSYAKKFKMLVLVDEAHGAHLNFSSLFPKSAINFDVDMVVQSAHKTLPVLTQSSFLHIINDTNIDLSRLMQALQIVQTSSPSYLLISSLDVCRKFMVEYGAKLLKRCLKISRWIRNEIDKIDGLKSYSIKELVGNDIFDYDETKVFFDTTESGHTGYELQNMLINKGIFVELVTHTKILLVLSVSTNKMHTRKLINALREISRDFNQSNPSVDNKILKIPKIPVKKMNPREAFFKPRVELALEDAIGKICADVVSVYPPGVAILIPGEVITEETIRYIKKIINLGGSVTGIGDNKICTVNTD